ncbi:MAG: nucleoside deaminase [Pseudobdellovibrio sp.]
MNLTLNDSKRQDHFNELDKKYMKLALKLAKKAEIKGEVPIGAVLVAGDGSILSTAINSREELHTVLGHAELMALHRACKKRKSWRLTDCTLYVTLEPCFMCAGALYQARVKRVIYATPDPKGGALKSLASLADDSRLNHRYIAQDGLFAEESSLMLKNFFKQKRNKKKSLNPSS